MAGALIASALSLNPFYHRGRCRVRKRLGIVNGLAAGGSTEPHRDYRDKELSADWWDLCEVFPDLKNYVWAPTDPVSEEKAVLNVASHMRVSSDKEKYFARLANLCVCNDTPRSKRPIWFDDGCPRLDDVLSAIACLRLDKSPGYPAVLFARTKQVVVDSHLADLVEAVYARLLALRYLGPRCKTAEEFYDSYCADFVAIGCKTEPVKVGKDARILMMNSVVTEVVEILLYREFDVSFKENVYEFYSGIGVGFSKFDSECLNTRLGHGQKHSSDVPKFDATKTLDEAFLTLDVVKASYGDVPDPVWVTMQSLETAFMTKVFVLGTGKLYIQKQQGWGGTGRRETANFNTVDRARRSYATALYLSLVGVVVPILGKSIDWTAAGQILDHGARIKFPEVSSVNCCAGDDCSEDSVSGVRSLAYAELGYPLRDSVYSDELTFCSHTWPLGLRPVGQRFFKALAKLLLNDVFTFEQFVGFAMEFGGNDDFRPAVRLISKHRREMKDIIFKMSCYFDSGYSYPVDYVEFSKKNKKKAVSQTVIVVGGQKTKPKKKKGKKKNQALAVERGMRGNQSGLQSMQRIQSMQKKATKGTFAHLFDMLLPGSAGCKFPDGTGNGTLSIPNRALYTFTSGSGGNSVLSITAGYPYNVLGVGSFSNPNYTMQASAGEVFNQALLTTLITTGNSTYRPVCGGMIIRCVQNAMTAQGTLIVSKLPNAIPESATFTSGTILGDAATFPITAGMEVAVLFKPNGIAAYDFVAQNTAATYGSGVNWDSIFIEITGCTASVPILEIEYLVNLEISVSNSDFGYQVLATKSPANPRAVDITHEVMQAVPSIIKGDGNTVQSTLSSVAKGVGSALVREASMMAMAAM